MTRDTKGRFAKAHQFIMTMIGYFIGITIFLFGTGFYVYFGMPVQASTSPVETSGCIEYAKDQFDCSDPATKAKWMSYLDGRNKELEVENEKLKGKPYSVSMFSRLDSCHNRVGSVCLTAGGHDVKEGWTVACPRSVALGTVVTIEGFGSRTCDDRTAQWVEEKFGGTFDVFTEDYEMAKKFGRKMLNVIIQ